MITTQEMEAMNSRAYLVLDKDKPITIFAKQAPTEGFSTPQLPPYFHHQPRRSLDWVDGWRNRRFTDPWSFPTGKEASRVEKYVGMIW